MKFAKFLRTPILKNISKRLLLQASFERIFLKVTRDVFLKSYGHLNLLVRLIHYSVSKNEKNVLAEGSMVDIILFS